jgi:anti-sigma B factor antagonist
MNESRVTAEQHESGVWLIDLIGEHDLSTVPAVSGALDEVFATGTRIVIDLSETTFIDSTTIGTLVDAQRRADDNPDESLIVVAPPESQARAVFDLVGVDQMLRISESRDAALADLTGT